MSKLDTGFFLESCKFGGILTGSQIYENYGRENIEVPFVGIMGFGKEGTRENRKSIWVNAQNLSSIARSNNGCAGHGHIEGIATDEGQLKILETIYDFPALEGSCIEYDLELVTNKNGILSLEGIATRRNFRETKKQEIGKINIRLDSHYWHGKSEDTFTIMIPSLPLFNQSINQGPPQPEYFKSFLEKIENAGFTHPYGAVTKALKEEKEKDQRNFQF